MEVEEGGEGIAEEQVVFQSKNRYNCYGRVKFCSVHCCAILHAAAAARLTHTAARLRRP